jgi:hypothetical protein
MCIYRPEVEAPPLGPIDTATISEILSPKRRFN